MPPSEATFSADALDHNIGPTGPTAAERRDLALALIAAAALHVIVPLALFAYYALWPVAPVPMVQEIPVEVVVEPPPPKPDKPEEKPKPPPQPEDEKPAYDAPRAATQEKVNRNSQDDKTQAPAARAEPPLNPGAPQKSESQAPAQEQEAQDAPPLLDLKPNADQPAAPAAPSTDADASPAAEKAEPNAAPQTAPQPPAEAPVGAPLPTIEALPQYKFARAAKDSPIVGGSAESRYFTIIYGMIRSHLREPSGPHAVLPSREGAVVFEVDEAGNLVGRKLANSSGSPSLDMAVMAAIAEAAPFPAPPNWRPKYLRLTYGGR